MDDKRFDDVAKALAIGADRRSILKRAAGGALAGVAGLLALSSRGAKGQPGCRQAGHPCEGNQVCCPGLECRVTGPGNARRCTARPTPTPPPKKCAHKGESCKHKPCCYGYECKDYYCREKPTCGYKGAYCSATKPCCKGYYCDKDHYCKKKN